MMSAEEIEQKVRKEIKDNGWKIESLKTNVLEKLSFDIFASDSLEKEHAMFRFSTEGEELIRIEDKERFFEPSGFDRDDEEIIRMIQQFDRDNMFDWDKEMESLTKYLTKLLQKYFEVARVDLFGILDEGYVVEFIDKNESVAVSLEKNAADLRLGAMMPEDGEIFRYLDLARSNINEFQKRSKTAGFHVTATIEED